MTTTVQEESRKEAAAQAQTENTRDVPVYTPAADIYETPDGIVVEADMPGVDKTSVEISLENNILTLRGHAAKEETLKDSTGLCTGFIPGDFERAFRLSHDVDRDGIRAVIKDGVLKVSIPKSEEARPRQIQVEAG